MAAKMKTLQNVPFLICANFRRTLRPLIIFDHREFWYANHFINDEQLYKNLYNYIDDVIVT